MSDLLPVYQEHLAEALRSGYSDEKLDLVVAVMTPSLEFAVKYHDKVFPRVPVVFMSITPPLPEKMGAGVTGVESPLGIPEIINLALRLHPDTEAVAVVSNVTGVDKDWLAAERVELLRHRDNLLAIFRFVVVEEIRAGIVGPGRRHLAGYHHRLPRAHGEPRSHAARIFYWRRFAGQPQ